MLIVLYYLVLFIWFVGVYYCFTAFWDPPRVALGARWEVQKSHPINQGLKAKEIVQCTLTTEKLLNFSYTAGAHMSTQK